MGSVIDNLENVQPPVINESLINGSNIVSSMINNANTTTDGLWFVWSILALWLWLIYILMRKDDIFLFDLPRTLLISSGWCLIISVGAALFTLTTNIFPLLWFSSIFFVSGIMVLRRVEKNR